MTRPLARLAVVGTTLVVSMLLAAGPSLARWQVTGGATASGRAIALARPAAPTVTVDGASTVVTWTPPTGLGPAGEVAGHLVERIAVDTGAPVEVAAGCRGVRAGTSCIEEHLPPGSWAYRVTPVLGSWRGAASPPSAAVTVHSTPPTGAITFPVAAAAYTTATWQAGCATPAGDLCGTAAPGANGLAIRTVDLAVQQPDGRWWDGASFTAGSQVWHNVHTAATPGASMGDATTDETSDGDVATAASAAPAAAPVSWHVPLDAAALAGDGTYAVSVRVVDVSGQEQHTESSFLLDRIAPTTTSDATTAWRRAPATVALTAGDDRSGIAATFYEVSGDGGATYGEPVAGTSVALTTDTFATYTVRFWSVDRAGNVEPKQTATVRLDNTAPTVTLTAPSSNVVVDRGQNVTLSASASDTGSGLARLGFARSSDGVTWTQIGTPLVPPATGMSAVLPVGVWRIVAAAEDQVPNLGTSTVLRTVTVRPVIAPDGIALVNTGRTRYVNAGDRIELTYSDALDPRSVCANFSATSTATQSATGLTLTFSGNPNVVSITNTGTCGATGVGSLRVGASNSGRYTTGTGTAAGSTLSWDHGARKVTITVGATLSNLGSQGASATAHYTPGALTANTAPIAPGTVVSATNQAF